MIAVPVKLQGLFLFATVAIAYGLGSQLAFSWFGADGVNASFFPAAGVTLSALVLVERRRWPVVLAGAAVAELSLDLWHDIALLPTLGYVVANLTQPVVGALLLTTLVRRVDLSRTYDLVAFLACAVVAAPLVGAALGASSFVFLDGEDGWARFAGEWWVGDGLGVLVVGAAVLSSRASSPRPASTPWILAGGVLSVVAVLATIAVFRFEKFALVYVPIVLLAALAFRTGTRGVALTGAVIAFVAAESTAEGSRYWEALDISAQTGLLYLQLALGVLIASALALAAEIAQREQTALALARTEAERTAALDRLTLFEAERAARERAELLERNAGHLAAAATAGEVASATVESLEAAGIPIVGVEALRGGTDGGSVSVLAVTGVTAETLATFTDYPVEAHTPGAEAIRTGRIVEIASGEEYDERFPETAHLRMEHGTESVVAVPLRSADNSVVGAVSGAAPQRGWFDEARKGLVTAIAEQTGLALERASLLEREREARARAELDEQLAIRLQHVTASLAAAETAHDVAQAAVTQLVEVLGGLGGSLFVVDERSGSLRLVEHASYPDEVVRRYREVPLDSPTPPAEAIRTRSPVLLGDIEALRAEYPDVAAEVGADPVAYGRAWAHVPLFVGTRPLGMVIVAFASPQPFDRRQRDVLVRICDAVAQALRRAELYEAERDARSRAELLESHAGRLAAAATAEDVARTTLAGLEEVGVAAAWVQLVRGDMLEMLGAFGVPAENLERYWRYRLELSTPPAEAARTGTAVVVGTAADLDARFPAATAGRRSLRYESLVSVPLVAADRRTLGVLSFASLEPDWLDEGRRLLVMGLAEQCGLAIERSQLRVEAEAAAQEAALLARLGEVLEREPGAHDRAEALVRALVEDRAAIAVAHSLDELGKPLVMATASRAGAELDQGRLDGVAAAALAAGAPRIERTDELLVMAAPLRARDRALGILTMAVPHEHSSRLSEVLLQRVATRAALALDNALLYEQERDVSHSLQMGLLGGELAAPDGVEIATAYKPGTAMLEVGGDWYDAFPLPGGKLALLVGDVVGHGLEAAVAMGQLRGAVRALAPVGPPREVLERLDDLVQRLPEAEMATLAYAVLDTGSGRVTYACAGHPPPLLVPAADAPELLWGGRSAPLGSTLTPAREEAEARLEPGDTILLYTDGLVERRGDGVSSGLDDLVEAARDPGDGPSSLVTRVLDCCLESQTQEDDVCILAVRRAVREQRFSDSFPAAPAEVARMRRAFARWLAEIDLDPERRRDATLAAAEAAANAAEHAYGFDGQGIVHVQAWISDGRLELSVRDEGGWREPDVASERGRGRTMMEALMQDVTIERRAGGTIVRMNMPMQGEVSV